MAGLGDQNQLDTARGDGINLQALERSQIYTVTGDVDARQVYQDPLIGKVLEDKYVVEAVIGWGGMSVVYRARHLLVDRVVAIKTVKFRADERPDIWQRFQREIITLSRLSHPNVVTVYDCLLGDRAQPYVVMDYIEGLSLDQLLGEKGRLSVEQVRLIACQVAAGVEHAHRHDVIHRDIKPANIMIIGNQVKVVDFGLAKLGADDQKLTQTGQLWGSPPYISPEQIKGGAVDHRSDIYSLAVVVYEMLTGRDPFYCDVVYEMLHKHLHSEPPPFGETCPELGPQPALELVLQKAMAKNPDERYQSMADFKEALEGACSLCGGGQFATTAAAPIAVSTLRAGYFKGEGLAGSNSATNLILLAVVALICGGALLVFIMAGGSGPSPSASTTGSSSKNDRSLPASAAAATMVPASLSSVVGPAQNHPAALPMSAAQSSERAHHRHLGQFRAFAPPAPRPPEHPSLEHRLLHRGERSANSSLVKKSLPNASQLRVDQSKFELLRDLKSPNLRRECGDLPQR
ncbi:MAG: serine/threonine protein kinase [Cyanobacteria bacterium REEB67]|nr:serine/threonine protein kinase [Cyanobacteria bacterium REEB67]